MERKNKKQLLALVAGLMTSIVCATDRIGTAIRVDGNKQSIAIAVKKNDSNNGIYSCNDVQKITTFIQKEKKHAALLQAVKSQLANAHAALKNNQEAYTALCFMLNNNRVYRIDNVQQLLGQWHAAIDATQGTDAQKQKVKQSIGQLISALELLFYQQENESNAVACILEQLLAVDKNMVQFIVEQGYVKCDELLVGMNTKVGKEKRVKGFIAGSIVATLALLFLKG